MSYAVFLLSIATIALAYAIGAILFMLLSSFMDSQKRALQIAAVSALLVVIIRVWCAFEIDINQMPCDYCLWW